MVNNLIETVKIIKIYLPTEKLPVTRHSLTAESYRLFKEELRAVLFKLFHKREKEGTLPEFLMKTLLAWYPNQTKTEQKGKLQYSLMNKGAKILNKLLEKQTQDCIKRIIHCDQVDFIPGMQGMVQHM